MPAIEGNHSCPTQPVTVVGQATWPLTQSDVVRTRPTSSSTLLMRQLAHSVRLVLASAGTLNGHHDFASKGQRPSTGAQTIEEDTMSGIKDMSRGGWMLIGVIVALLLVPTAAGAATLYNGIVGTSGHKADVTATGQLKVSAAGTVSIGNAVTTKPSADNYTPGQVNPGSSWTTVVGQGVPYWVTAINVDTWGVNPGFNSAIQFAASSNGCLTTGPTLEAVNPGGIGETSIDVGTGLFLPGDWSLCAINNDTTNLHAAVFVTVTY